MYINIYTYIYIYIDLHYTYLYMYKVCLRDSCPNSEIPYAIQWRMNPCRLNCGIPWLKYAGFRQPSATDSCLKVHLLWETSLIWNVPLSSLPQIVLLLAMQLPLEILEEPHSVKNTIFVEHCFSMRSASFGNRKDCCERVHLHSLAVRFKFYCH